MTQSTIAILGPDDPVGAPLKLHRERVHRDWIDVNRHMNVAYYVLAFDHATDALVDHIDLGNDHVARGGGMIFIVEAHVTYSRELLCDDPMVFHSYILDFDEKRIHYAHQMYHADQGYLAATKEAVLLHVGAESRRSAPMPALVLARLARIKAAHEQLPRPRDLSRKMGLTPQKRSAS